MDRGAPQASVVPPPPSPARPNRSAPRLRSTLLRAALVALLLSAGGGGAQDAHTAAPGSTEAPTASAVRGLELYLELRCGVCHASRAAGTGGFFGPPHEAMAVVAAARVADPGYSGAATDAAGYLRESLVAPGSYLVPGYGGGLHRMPAYSHLPPVDLDALVAFLLEPPSGESAPATAEPAPGPDSGP